MLIALAGLVIAVGAGLNHAPADLAVLGTALALIFGVAMFLLADFRESPAKFPGSSGLASQNPQTTSTIRQPGPSG